MYFIWSDPHLGVTRKAHTTLASSVALQAAIEDQIAKIGRVQTITGKRLALEVVVGDLFDRAHNTEQVILSARRILRPDTTILAGNHDLILKAGEITSLNLLWETTPKLKVFFQRYGQAEAFKQETFSTLFYFVPYCATQKLFLSVLNNLLASKIPSTACLFLHCLVAKTDFFELPSENSTSNMLPYPMMRELMHKFDFIFIGHEHIPWNMGNVFVTGNIYPTSFGDISDKYVYSYDEATRNVTMTEIFSKEKMFYQGPPYEIPNTAKFLDLTERVETKRIIELFEQGALLVRMQDRKEHEVAEITEPKYQRLPLLYERVLERIEKELGKDTLEKLGLTK